MTSGLNAEIDEISNKVKSLGGLFIPAHIDKQMYSVISQLGYIPPDIEYDAVELSEHGNKEKILQQHPYLKNKSFIRSSDAHFPDKIGNVSCKFEIATRSFQEIRQALHNENGRRVFWT